MKIVFADELARASHLIEETRFELDKGTGYGAAYQIEGTELSVAIHSTGAYIVFIDNRKLPLRLGDYCENRSALTDEAKRIVDSDLRSYFNKGDKYLMDSELSFDVWINEIRMCAM